MSLLRFDTYGKTAVRLLQVLHQRDQDAVVELSVNVLFQGDFADSYTEGDNSRVLSTDTMKNTIYALARQRPIESIEQFGSQLGEHFLPRLPHVHTVTVDILQVPWNRIGDHPGAFMQNATERRTTSLACARERVTVVSGLQNLQILKTSQSGFAGYIRDEYTTLKETDDRLLGTVLHADWTLANHSISLDFNMLHQKIRETLLEVFSTHASSSVQHTLYAMGSAVIEAFDAVQEIKLTMPNKHCLLIDLSKFQLDNPNQIFVPTDEPSGFIEARIAR